MPDAPENSLYPLPPDYLSLSPGGKKEARIAAVRRRDTPGDDVLSWLFFRDYYLRDQSWYDGWRDPAPGHLEWCRIVGQYPRTVIAAHRGSAKSTIFKEFVLRDAVSVPNSSSLLVCSSDEKVMRTFDPLMHQIENNEKIKQDFGKLKSGRSIWNHTTLILENRAKLFGGAARSISLRGERPKRILLDDVEYDQKSGTNIEARIADMENLLFDILLPMLRKGSSFNMLGTPFSAMTVLWRLITQQVEDPRIDPTRWYTRVFPGCNEDLKSDIFWPAEYDPEDIKVIAQEWGESFAPEFLCQPHKQGFHPLKIVPDLNYYWTEGEKHPTKDADPLRTIAKVRWNDCRIVGPSKIETTPRQEPTGALWSDMFRFITVDPCRKPSRYSDYAAALVIGVDKLRQRWALDLLVERMPYGALCKAVWKLVVKWQCKLVCVESIGLEINMFSEFQGHAYEFMRANGWVPAIRPITEYKHGLTKEDRIQGLGPLLESGLIKLPGNLKDAPPWRALTHQIEWFSASGKALAHDDAVDALAMTQEVVRGGARSLSTVVAAPTVEERLRAGEITDKLGIPLVAAMGLDKVPRDIMAKLLYDGTGEPVPGEPRVEWA